MKILVLGGNGFIGTNLCNYLAESGYDVYSFDMILPKKRNPKVHYVEGDFFDDYVLENITEGMDVIFHGICTLNPGNSREKYMLGYQRDFIQTVKLCAIVEKNRAKLIFLSSGGTVYGEQKVQPITEDAKTVPINHYGNLKLCIENLIRTFNTQCENKMIIARISNPYGPGQDYHKGVGFIDAVLKRAMEGSEIEIYGDGNTVRDYIYIEDVCKMLARLVEYNGEHELFNISSARGVSQKEILQLVDALVPQFRVRYTAARSVDVKKIILDNSRYMGEFHVPLIPIEEGIRKYYQYLTGAEENA